nr:hypothetical protein [Proteus mirabilis]
MSQGPVLRRTRPRDQQAQGRQRLRRGRREVSRDGLTRVSD